MRTSPFFFLVPACLFVVSFWLLLFKANFKYICLIMEKEYQRMDEVLETHSYPLIWVLNIVSFLYRMLPFYMALVWSTSITMPFNGKLEWADSVSIVCCPISVWLFHPQFSVSVKYLILFQIRCLQLLLSWVSIFLTVTCLGQPPQLHEKESTSGEEFALLLRLIQQWGWSRMTQQAFGNCCYW